MLHLDIKPANIFITTTNKGRVARLWRREVPLSKGRQLHPPMYTPGFAAPDKMAPP